MWGPKPLLVCIVELGGYCTPDAMIQYAYSVQYTTCMLPGEYTGLYNLLRLGEASVER